MVRRYKKRSTRTRKYKSQLELAVARKLGKKAKYETELIQYLLPKRYTPDFVIETPDLHIAEAPKKIYLEVKGWFRYEDQAKMRAVKTCNPALDIRMYFPNDGKVQGSKMTNSEWCSKYLFPCYIGRLPKDL